MLKVSRMLCFAALGLAPGEVLGQDLNDLIGMATLGGRCEKLIAAGHDLTAACSDKIVQSIYDTGRTGFTLPIGYDGAVITFSGVEGRKPDPDTQLQSVDKVILNLAIEGVSASMKDAKGGCQYRNPYNGPMLIGCHAVDDDGQSYSLQFRTDGSQPEFAEFNGAAAQETLGNGDFVEGAWAGGPFTGDPDGGCLMSKDLGGGAMLMVYANGNEAFQLHFYNESWSFEPGATMQAELFFDGVSFRLSGAQARNEHVLTVLGGGEEEGFQPPFEQSSRLQLTFGGEQVTVDLAGSRAATSKLWACVADTSR